MIQCTSTYDAAVIDTQKLGSITAKNSVNNASQAVKVIFVSYSFRLDNRAEILAELKLTDTATNHELLAEGWLAWRQDLASRLRGAFAFGVFDAASGIVYVARDIFGTSPIFWASDDSRIILAASSRGARALLSFSPAHNKTTLADFICGGEIQREQTFFEHIVRHPPAHWMTIDQNGVQQTRYWSSADVPRAQPVDSLVRQFREHFQRSVRSCFSSGKSVLFLSGGLDSSSIAGALHADGITVPSLSLVYPETKDWTDKAYLAELEDGLGISLEGTPSDAHNPLEDISKWLAVVDGPYLPYGHSVSSQLLLKARALGFEVVLSGHGGDEIVSYGFGRLNELARKGQWLRLWRETSAAAGLYHESRIRLFRRYLSQISWFRKVEQKLRLQVKGKTWSGQQYLADSFAKEIDPARYRRKFAGERLDHDERMIHEEVFNSPLQPLSLEVIAICSHAEGVETRMPFYDRELIELSLSLPSNWKLRGGLSRFILRKAMEDALPRAVVLRQDKFDFTDNFKRGLLANKAEVLALTDPETHNLGAWVNIDLLQTIRSQFSGPVNSIETVDAFFLWRTAVLATWLKVASEALSTPQLHLIQEG
jgi:asparagine synthase (glutamine-hydrolysing)